MIKYLALLTAIGISAVAGYFSVMGLTAIFASAVIPIAIMGAILEIGKLISASLLYRKWNVFPKIIKYPLTIFVVVISLITSMGIFGFLSKAHIEQQYLIQTTNSTGINELDFKISQQKILIVDIDKQIALIDDAITKLTNTNKANNALAQQNNQRKTKEELLKKKAEINTVITAYSAEKNKLTLEVAKLEAEVGPLKYIADLYYGKADNEQLEKAVRMVIIIIVMVFDPLAILLLIAANHSIVTETSEPKKRKYTKRLQNNTKNDIIQVDKKEILKL